MWRGYDRTSDNILYSFLSQFGAHTQRQFQFDVMQSMPYLSASTSNLMTMSNQILYCRVVIQLMQLNQIFLLFSPLLPDSYWTNPQYRVKIYDGNSVNHGEKNLLVSLMQKPDKRNRRLVQNLHIGISVFEVNIVLCFPITVFRWLWTFWWKQQKVY